MLLGLFFGLAALGGLTGTGIVLTAAHLENNDSFCASCHSEPEATFYSRTQTTTATDLASFHSRSQRQGQPQPTACIDCHSGAGLPGRLSAMLLGARDLAAFSLHMAKQPATLTVPISDANCLKCHADTVATRDFQRHFHAFLPRWQAQDPNAAKCVDCHTGHTQDGDATLMFLQRDRTEQVCQACHTATRE